MILGSGAVGVDRLADVIECRHAFIAFQRRQARPMQTVRVRRVDPKHFLSVRIRPRHHRVAAFLPLNHGFQRLGGLGIHDAAFRGAPTFDSTVAKTRS